MRFVTAFAAAITVSATIAPMPSTNSGSMQDLLWLAIVGGLLLLTLAYVRLCDKA